jgi:16S rRNA (adenine1518-N6/adenine1519-N6)-dimethyltransferase
VDKVRPKKALGQHFLHSQSFAQRIVSALKLKPGDNDVVEIGPGMGALTRYLVNLPGTRLRAVELDRDSVAYLQRHYNDSAVAIIEGDFLALNDSLLPDKFAIIGNFPYNISSQIFFRVLEMRDRVTQVVCMLQKEVADRIAAPPGSKTYGILSVLLQAYYSVDNLFKVPPGAFTPPPRVMSAVIRLSRNTVEHLGCDERLFTQVVKQAFNTRRKTLRNALKNLNLAAEISAMEIMNKRAEQLSVADFVGLTQVIQNSRGSTSASV